MNRPDGTVGASILFVSDERAWPPISGYRHRTRLVLSTLATLGPVSWIAAPRNRYDDGDLLEIPAHLRDRIDGRLVATRTRGTVATGVRWLRSGLPWPLAAGDWSAAEAVLGELTVSRFELVWAMGLDAMAAVERAGVSAPVMVVDADLESLKLERQLSDGAAMPRLRSALARIDVGRWRRLERSAADRLTGFSVCSEPERDRLGSSAFVTPNAYPEPPPAAPRPDPTARRRTLLFVGSMGYEPNRQGVEWFVTEVLEPLRQRHPGARIRIVGSGPPVDRDLRGVAGVEVVGPVSDVRGELERAAAVVVPIHWGAGTRVKILEAMAHRVPVISTTVGAEGLDLEDGRHLLVADGPESFAAACARALDGDPELAAMVERADEVFRRCHAEDVVSHRLAQRVRDLLADSR